MAITTITVTKSPNGVATVYTIDDATDLGVLLILPNIPGGTVQ